MSSWSYWPLKPQVDRFSSDRAMLNFFLSNINAFRENGTWTQLFAQPPALLNGASHLYLTVSILMAFQFATTVTQKFITEQVWRNPEVSFLWPQNTKIKEMSWEYSLLNENYIKHKVFLFRAAVYNRFCCYLLSKYFLWTPTSQLLFPTWEVWAKQTEILTLIEHSSAFGQEKKGKV